MKANIIIRIEYEDGGMTAESFSTEAELVQFFLTAMGGFRRLFHTEDTCIETAHKWNAENQEARRN